MTFTVRLEQADGTPDDAPTMESTVTNWRTGDQDGRLVLGRGHVAHRPDHRLHALQHRRQIRKILRLGPTHDGGHDEHEPVSPEPDRVHGPGDRDGRRHHAVGRVRIAARPRVV